MSGNAEPNAELVAALAELLERATRRQSSRPADAPSSAQSTAWQQFAGELRDLCRRVLDDADEATAATFWSFLIATAAQHGRRAGEWPS